MNLDVAQELEDLLEELAQVQKAINKLQTKSVSGGPLRKQIKEIHKRRWLPVVGVLEAGSLVDVSELSSVSNEWKKLVKLADGLNPKTQYRPVIKSIIGATESSLLHSFIKNSAIQTIGAFLPTSMTLNTNT